MTQWEEFALGMTTLENEASSKLYIDPLDLEPGTKAFMMITEIMYRSKI